MSGSNTVFTDDIADDTRPASGGNPAGGLVAADLRPNSVGSSEVANNGLTGTDINESTLQGVNAARVGGADVCDGLVTISNTPSNADIEQQVCSAAPLSITARCVSFGGGNTQGTLTLQNSANHSFYARSDGQEDPDWNNAEADNVLVGTGFTGANVARLAFSAGATNGSQLAGEVAVRTRALGGETGTCQFAMGLIG